jgi:hypothetical protein
MQEINLLQNKLKDRSEAWDRRNTIVGVVLGAILVLVLAAGAFLYYLNSDAKTKASEIQTENLSIQSKLDSSQGSLASAKSFQAQLRNIDKLLTGHIYWSKVFDTAQTTIIKNSQYSLFQAKTDGKIHVEGLVSNMDSLGKLLLSLSTNPDLTGVKLISAQSNPGATAGYKFAMDFVIKPELLFKK